jgi:hypothetical protein
MIEPLRAADGPPPRRWGPLLITVIIGLASLGVLIAIPVVAFTSGTSTPKPPVPTASPEGTFSLPPLTAWPGPTNTGTHGPLRKVGSMVITQPGTYSNLEVDGRIDVRSAGVVLLNDRVTGQNQDWAVRNFSGHLLVLADCDLGPDTPSGHMDADVVYANYAMYRCNVHGSNDGLKANGNVTIRDSWIHDLHTDSDIHPDGIQMSSGHDVLIEHNRIDAFAYDNGRRGSAVSTVNIKADLGGISQVVIQNNELTGFAGYLIYVRSSKYGTPAHVSVLDNTLGPKESAPNAHDGYSYGVASISKPGPAWVDNHTSNGTPIPLP